MGGRSTVVMYGSYPKRQFDIFNGQVCIVVAGPSGDSSDCTTEVYCEDNLPQLDLSGDGVDRRRQVMKSRIPE